MGLSKANSTSFKKGQTPWNKGNVAHRCIDCGKRLTNVNGQRCKPCFLKTGWISKRQTKELNHMWKGGITSLNGMIRNLTEHRNWSQLVLKKDNWTCQKCGDKNYVGRGETVPLESHHIKPFKDIVGEFLREYDQFSPIEDKETLQRLAIKYKPFWDINNGTCLCKKCHRLKEE